MTLDELRDRETLTSADIDAFIASNTFPIVDPHGVTFVYRGEARSVQLRNFVFGLPTAQPLQRVKGTDLWHLHIDLPPKSRLEYKFEVDSDTVKGWILDPLNAASAGDPFGANSVCSGWGYERPDWTNPDVDARAGTLEEIQLLSAAFGETRPVRLYLPARFRRTRQYPLLVVHDGDDFLRFAALRKVPPDVGLPHAARRTRARARTDGLVLGRTAFCRGHPPVRPRVCLWPRQT